MFPTAHEGLHLGLDLGSVLYAGQVAFAAGFIAWVYREAWRKLKNRNST